MRHAWPVLALLTQLVQARDHRTAIFIGIDLDVVADGRGGEQPADAIRNQPFFGDDAVEFWAAHYRVLTPAVTIKDLLNQKELGTVAIQLLLGAAETQLPSLSDAQQARVWRALILSQATDLESPLVARMLTGMSL